MNKSLETVNSFLQLTGAGDAAGAARLLTEDVVFAGPLMTTVGSAQYAALLEKFLPAHVATRVRSQFVNDEEVCSINELDLRTPAGGTVTLAMAEWFRVRGGKISEHKVYYDPREFERAFGVG